jgi:predicted DNA-binding protein (UPF0251 family)
MHIIELHFIILFNWRLFFQKNNKFNVLWRHQLPRPKKHRHCGCTIKGSIFKPTGTPLYELKQIQLQRDELETLRLCDREGLAQEEAGSRMGVSRGTVQRLLSSARKKVASALVEGAAIVLEDMEENSRQ